MINGSNATATATDGSQHDVQLPDKGSNLLKQQLYKDQVDLPLLVCRRCRLVGGAAA
jgi:hypothetical protein